MSIVVDASVALKWVLDEDDSDAALAVRDNELVAPSLWLAEAANALWRRSVSGELTHAEVTERLSLLTDAPVTSTPIELDLAEAVRLAVALSHPVYDCLYLAAALREETYVVTADRRFHAAATALLPSAVRLLSSLG
jgi:predicted nucleic acid-binding protein